MHAVILRLTSEQLFEPIIVDVTWTVIEEGWPMCSGSLPSLTIHSGASLNVTLDLTRVQTPSRPCALTTVLGSPGNQRAAGRKGVLPILMPREHRLNVDAHLAASSAALPAGHLLAHTQREFPSSVSPTDHWHNHPLVSASIHDSMVSIISRHSTSRMIVDQTTPSIVRLSTAGLAVGFNTSTGALSELSWMGQPLLLSELRPNFCAAPTFTTHLRCVTLVLRNLICSTALVMLRESRAGREGACRQRSRLADAPEASHVACSFGPQEADAP